jgi:hypothetical protein
MQVGISAFCADNESALTKYEIVLVELILNKE